MTNVCSNLTVVTNDDMGPVIIVATSVIMLLSIAESAALDSTMFAEHSRRCRNRCPS